MAIKHLANLDLNNNEIKNVKIDVVQSDPSGMGAANVGRIIYNSDSSTKEMKYWDGQAWVSMKNTDTDVDVSVANLEARLPQIDSNVTIGDAADVTVTTSGDLTVTGDLTVNGTTTTVNSTTTTVDDPIFTVGGDSAPGSDDNKDRGIEFRYHDGSQARLGFFGFDDSTGKFTFIPNATNSSEVFSGNKGNIDINNIDLAGSIKTVDGSAPTDGQILIGHTANQDMELATITAGTGITVTNSAGGIQIGSNGLGGKFAALLDNSVSGVSKSSNTFTVTHGLATRDVMVQVYEAASPYENIQVDIARSASNTNDITIDFAADPGNGNYRVLVTKIA
jgi:hypothetical protein